MEVNMVAHCCPVIGGYKIRNKLITIELAERNSCRDFNFRKNAIPTI